VNTCRNPFANPTASNPIAFISPARPELLHQIENLPHQRLVIPPRLPELQQHNSLRRSKPPPQSGIIRPLVQALRRINRHRQPQLLERRMPCLALQIRRCASSRGKCAVSADTGFSKYCALKFDGSAARSANNRAASCPRGRCRQNRSETSPPPTRAPHIPHRPIPHRRIIARGCVASTPP
jgi:hypothetical protein